MGIVFDQSLNTTDNVQFVSLSLGDDTKLVRDSANTFAMRNGTSPNNLNVYNTYTSNTDYERLEVKWDSGVPTIAVAVDGNGNYPNWLQIQNESSKFLVKHNGFEFQDATTLLQLNPTNIKVFKDLYPNNDDETSFGTSSNRWRDIYSFSGSFSGDLVVEDGGNQYIYNTYTDASNYERLELKWNISNVAEINTAAAGTGIVRTLRMRQSGGSYWADWEAAGIKFYGAASLNFNVGSAATAFYKNINPDTDGSVSCGTSASRWSNTYSIDGSFSRDLNIEDGGAFKLFGLGDSHTNTTDTQYLEMSSTTQSFSITTLATGTGVSRDIYMSVGGTSNIMLRSDHTRLMQYVRPQTTNTTDIGTSSFRFRKSYLVDGSFSGDFVIEDGGSQYFYNTYTDASNYERLEIKWDANVATIATTFDGTGSSRELKVGNISDGNYVRFLPGSSWRGYAGSTEVFKVDGAAFEVSRKIAAGSDSALDIGSSTFRFRKSYLVDGSFSGDLNIEVGGSYKLYNLGAAGDTDTEYLETSFQFGKPVIRSLSTGNGVTRDLFVGSISGARLEVRANGQVFVVGSGSSIGVTSSGVSLDGGAVYPASNDATTLGSPTRFWSRIYSVDGSFSGDLVTEAGGNQYIYNTYTDASNYERLEIKWDSNEATIATTADGTGTQRQLVLNGSSVLTKIAGINKFNVSSAINYSYQTLQPGSDSVYTLGAGPRRWSTTYTDSIAIGQNTLDAVLTADAADTLALRNSTNAQAFHIYSTYTDASNYERLQFRVTATGSYIETTSDGTGIDRALFISNGSGTNRGLIIGSTNRSYTDFHPQTDSAVDLGVTSKRWANTYTDNLIATDNISNGDGSQTLPSYTFASQTNMGMSRTATNQMGLHAAGNLGAVVTTASIHIGSTSYYGWRSAAAIGQGAANETRLRREDKGVLGITTWDDSPTGLYIHNTLTDSSNYERLEFKWDANVAKIGTTEAGTGSARPVQLFSNTNASVLIAGGKNIDFTGNANRFWRQSYPISDGTMNFGLDVLRWATTYTKGFATDVETFTAASDTLDAKNNVALCDCTSNAITINLPAASTATGLQFYITKVDNSANTVTIDPDSSETIDGSATKVLTVQYQSVKVVSDGSNWYSVASQPSASDVEGSGTAGSLAVWTDTDTIGTGLLSESSNVLTQKNSTNAQAYHLYNTDDGAGNYERLEFKWDSNVATIATTAAGTGTAQSLRVGGDGFIFLADNTGDFFVSTNGVPRWYKTMRPHQPSAISSGSNTTRWLNTYTKNLYIGDTAVDTVLTADADNELALRNGTNAQTQRIYRSYTDASNNQGMEFLSDTFNRINSFANGTGTLGSIEIQVGGSRRFRGDASFAYIQGQTGGYIFYGSNALKPQSANSIDLGGTSNRWTNTYSVDGDFSGDLTVSGPEGKLVLSGQSSAFDTTSGAVSTIYQSDDDGGSYPFTTVGNLILQSRQNSSRDIVFATGTTPNVRMVVAGNGNVGIGINVPTSPLHVVGNIHNTGTITTDGGFADLLAVSGTSAPELRINSTDSVIFDGDEFGRLQWYMNDANTNGTGAAARISAIFNDTVSGSPAQQTAGEGTDLVFSTGLVLVTGQTQTVTEKLRIDKNGTFKHAVGTNSYWYNLDTDASNYERLEVKWDANEAVIRTASAGTGTTRDLMIKADPGSLVKIEGQQTGDNTICKMYLNGSERYSFFNEGISGVGRYLNFGGLYLDSTARLVSDANYQFDMRNGTNPNSLNIYNTYTDASNYERGIFGWDGNILKIGVQADGTGSASRPVSFYTNSSFGFKSAGGSTRFNITTSNVSTYLHFQPSADSSKRNGADTLRWLNTYTDKITIGDGVDAVLTADAADTLALRNGTNAQAFRVYKTDDGAGNTEYLETSYDGTNGEYAIKTGATGTGSTIRNVYIGTGFGGTNTRGLIVKNSQCDFNFGGTRLVVKGTTIDSYANFAPINDGAYELGLTAKRWSNTYTNTITIGDGVDAILTADADNELALRNGTNAQKFSIYQSYTDASNRSWLDIGYQNYGGRTAHWIASKALGTGTEHDLVIGDNSNKIWFRAAYGIMHFTAGGASRLEITQNGILPFDTIFPWTDGSQDIGTDAKRFANIFTDKIIIGDNLDAILEADADNQLALRNGTNAQQFNVYNTYTDASNYERLEIGWDSNVATIKTAASGTGTQRTLRLGDNTNVAKTYIDVTTNQAGIKFYDNHTWILDITDSHVRSYRTIMPGIDITYNLGTTSLRWANTYTNRLYASDELVVGATSSSSVDHEVELYKRTLIENTSSQLFTVRRSGDPEMLNINSSQRVIRLFGNNDTGSADSNSLQIFGSQYIYNTYTDASNYERLEVKWDTNTAYISTNSAGTGSARGLAINGEDAIRLDVAGLSGLRVTGSSVKIWKPISPQADGTDSGTASSRWGTTYTKGIATDVETFTAASDTLSDQNNVCLCDCTSNAITINLPAASTASGLQYHIKKIDSSSNTVTVDADGTETIDGALTQVISAQYESITIVCDGSNWHII